MTRWDSKLCHRAPFTLSQGTLQRNGIDGPPAMLNHRHFILSPGMPDNDGDNVYIMLQIGIFLEVLISTHILKVLSETLPLEATSLGLAALHDTFARAEISNEALEKIYDQPKL